MNPTDFGTYLKALREEKGMTLIELANQSGTSHPYLSQIENGRKGVPSTKVLKKLSAPLEVPYMELMYKAGHIENPPVAVDFLGEDLNNFTFWFNDLKKNYCGELRTLQVKYQQQLGENFTLTPKTLKNLIYEEPLKDGVANLFDELKRLVERMKKEEQCSAGSDLKTLLENQSKVTLNGHQLTEQDRQRALAMLDILFPEYAKRP